MKWKNTLLIILLLMLLVGCQREHYVRTNKHPEISGCSFFCKQLKSKRVILIRTYFSLVDFDFQCVILPMYLVMIKWQIQ